MKKRAILSVKNALWSNGETSIGIYDFICSMALVFNKLRRVLGSRVALNIYFWVLLLLFTYELNANEKDYPQSVYLSYKAVTTLLLFILTYTNNLLLVPKFLARKRRTLYLLSAAILLFAIAACFVLLVKHLQVHYPLAEVYHVSIITMPVGHEMSIAAIIEETIGYSLGLLIWLGAFTMAWYMQDHSKQKRMAEEATHKQMQAELDLLRNQLNPHFLFNTLNNIYGLSLQKSDKAPESILKLSSIMRYMLYDTDVPMVSFEKEKEIMQAYIDMELLRLQNADNLHFRIEADGQYQLPPLLWLPVMENLFKHGTRFTDGELYIDYQFIIRDNRLMIVAENNTGTNIKTAVGGLGLANLAKRLEILYPDKHSTQITQTPGKYRIELNVSLD